MTDETEMAAIETTQAQPVVRTVGTADLIDALAKGLSDFNSKPTHVLFLCLIYPVVGLILATLSLKHDLLPLLFPLVSGFALVGPVAATGIYELSRRREQGLDNSWWHVFDVLRSPSLPALAALGAVLAIIFFAWLNAALMIYGAFFDNTTSMSFTEFASQVFTTTAGWGLIIVGCGVGFVFAVIVLSISVVSFPMLLDRKVSAVTAVQTSIQAVLANPKSMLTWGAIVAGALVIGSLPFLVGLAIVLPLLGHATWHLYRKVIEWDISAPSSGGEEAAIPPT